MQWSSGAWFDVASYHRLYWVKREPAAHHSPHACKFVLPALTVDPKNAVFHVYPWTDYIGKFHAWAKGCIPGSIAPNRTCGMRLGGHCDVPLMFSCKVNVQWTLTSCGKTQHSKCSKSELGFFRTFAAGQKACAIDYGALTTPSSFSIILKLYFSLLQLYKILSLFTHIHHHHPTPFVHSGWAVPYQSAAAGEGREDPGTGRHPQRHHYNGMYSMYTVEPPSKKHFCWEVVLFSEVKNELLL